MTHATRPLRAILNFTHRCAMNCEWCYVPFGLVPARKEYVLSIVERIAELGFTSITIGGGDPFQYRFTPELLRYAKSLGLFVHVDTHGKTLQQSVGNIELIGSTVDLLGLPIDGSKREIHDQMRDSEGHFDLISRRLCWLKPWRSRIKLNTVVSAFNVHDLTCLSHLVELYAPSRWSIYQYWPLGPATGVSTKHSIDDQTFERSAEILRKNFSHGSTVLEVNSYESRRDTYPIIHHDGEMFVHSQAPANAFVPLGSIFESDALEKILFNCSVERPSAIGRYTHYLNQRLATC